MKPTLARVLRSAPVCVRCSEAYAIGRYRLETIASYNSVGDSGNWNGSCIPIRLFDYTAIKQLFFFLKPDSGSAAGELLSRRSPKQ